MFIPFFHTFFYLLCSNHLTLTMSFHRFISRHACAHFHVFPTYTFSPRTRFPFLFELFLHLSHLFSLLHYSYFISNHFSVYCSVPHYFTPLLRYFSSLRSYFIHVFSFHIFWFTMLPNVFLFSVSRHFYVFSPSLRSYFIYAFQHAYSNHFLCITSFNRISMFFLKSYFSLSSVFQVIYVFYLLCVILIGIVFISFHLISFFSAFDSLRYYFIPALHTRHFTVYFSHCIN